MVAQQLRTNVRFRCMFEGRKMSRFNSKKVGQCFGLVMGQLCYPSKGTPGQYDITTETKAERPWQLSAFGTTRTRDIFFGAAATLERLQSMENMLCTDHLHHLCTTWLNLRGCTQLLHVQNLPSKK